MSLLSIRKEKARRTLGVCIPGIPGRGVGKVSLVASVSRYARQEVVGKVTFPEQFLWWKTTSAVCMADVVVVK